MAQSGIHIKPSKVGTLRKAVHAKEGKNLTSAQLAIKPGDSPAMRKKKQFAINARKWH